MKKKKGFTLVEASAAMALITILVFAAGLIFAEEITVKTTIPSQTVARSKTAAIGDTWSNPSTVPDSAFTSSPDIDLLVEENVGIGTTEPIGQMHIYNGTTAAFAIDSPNSMIDWRAGDGGVDAQLGRANNTIFANIIYASSKAFGTLKQWAVGLRNLDSNYHIYSDGGATGTFEGLTIQQTTGHVLIPGHVGIGQNPAAAYRLEVSGDMMVQGSIYNLSGESICSDLRLKKNIEELTNVVKKLDGMKGVRFDWRSDEFPDKKLPEGKQIGMIAQDVENGFPELVGTDKKGYKYISYDKFTAVLLEAVKEQQRIIDKQQGDIDSLKKEVAEIKTLVKK